MNILYKSGAKEMFKRLLLLMTLLLVVSGAVMAQDAYNESPVLAERVAAGELPPVAERLPANPPVVEPVAEVGQYGGTWRLLDTNNDLGQLQMSIAVEPFLKWNRDTNGMRPNLAASWEWNDDATEVTVQFVEGIKWSDGDPLTVDDYLFYWNDMVLDEDVPVLPPSGTTIQGEIMTVAKVDDYTLTFTFPAPNPLFMELSSRGFYQSSQYVVPEHYMRQFHPKYNTEVTDTAELMNHFNARMHYPDMPTYYAWQVTEYVPDQLVRLTRNPYYWKVDTAGNQLPYIDNIEVQIATVDEFPLRAIAGELDMQVRGFAFKDIPLLLENQEAGDYTVKMWNSGDFAWPWLILMYDYPDEGIVDLMYTPQFRRALSFSINRDRINEISSLGLAQPRQFALSPESQEFQSEEGQAVYEEWASSYAAYEPETAGALLDEIGVVDADGDGYRDRADGTPLELIVDMATGDAKTEETMELIRQDWEAIGLKTTINATEWSIIDQRAEAGEVMIRAWPSAAAWGLVSAATGWTPIEGVTYSVGGIRIGRYYQTGGAEGIAPREGSMLEQLTQLYDQIVVETDPAVRDQMLLDAYRIHIDEGPITIGTVGQHPAPVVVKNNVHNVPDMGLVSSWDLGYPGTVDPEQFFITE
jgi:peptide/nickel transport system substrate-binding protein